jgi:hypothetical protein
MTEILETHKQAAPIKPGCYEEVNNKNGEEVCGGVLDCRFGVTQECIWSVVGGRGPLLSESTPGLPKAR